MCEVSRHGKGIDKAVEEKAKTEKEGQRTVVTTGEHRDNETTTSNCQLESFDMMETQLLPLSCGASTGASPSHKCEETVIGRGFTKDKSIPPRFAENGFY